MMSGIIGRSRKPLPDVADVRFWPVSDIGAVSKPARESGFSLLCHFQGVIDLDTQVSDCTLEFRMAKQELNGPQVLGSTVYQGRLSAPQRMGPIGCRIQTDFPDPSLDDSAILLGRQVRGIRPSA